MANFDFSVAGVAQKVCLAGSDDRFEIKQVVDGASVPYRVDGNPVFVGGSHGECVLVSEDGDYTIEWSDAICDDNAPTFTVIAVDPSDDGCCGSGGLDVQVLERCDLVTKTVWYKTLWFESVDGATPVQHVLSDWTDSEIVCALDESTCSTEIVELFGNGDLAAVEGKSFNDLTIYNPGCCEIAVSTDAGSFKVMPGEGGFEKRFACPVVVTGVVVTGDCDKSKVHFIFINDGLG